MIIDVSIKYQLSGMFDPDNLSNKLGIVPDSTERIGEYQRRFTGLPDAKILPREKPFAVAYWCSSVRKDIDISSFNQFFDFIVSIFTGYYIQQYGESLRCNDGTST